VSRLVVGVLAFAAGTYVGIQIAKYYAESKVQGGIDAGLNKLGLGGGAIQSFVDGSVVPVLVG